MFCACRTERLGTCLPWHNANDISHFADPAVIKPVLLAFVLPLGLLLAGCAPDAPAEKADKSATEAGAAAREALDKAGEAAKKLGEASSEAAKAVIEAAAEKARASSAAAEEALRENSDVARGVTDVGVRDAKEAAEAAAHRIAEATRGAAQRLKEVGQDAIGSVRHRDPGAAVEPTEETVPSANEAPSTAEK